MAVVVLHSYVENIDEMGKCVISEIWLFATNNICISWDHFCPFLFCTFCIFGWEVGVVTVADVAPGHREEVGMRQ